MITRQIVNEAGQVEIWLGDSSRKLTDEELQSLLDTVERAQSAARWNAAVSAATSLRQVVIFRWNEDQQCHLAYRMDGFDRPDVDTEVPAIELEALRQQILSRRAAAEAAPSIFTVGGVAS